MNMQDTTPIATPAVLPDPALRPAKRPYTTPEAIAIGRATEVVQGSLGNMPDFGNGFFFYIPPTR